MAIDIRVVKNRKGLSGLFFPGPMLVGMGIGMALNFMPWGLLIGVSLGFVFMALWRYRTGEW